MRERVFRLLNLRAGEGRKTALLCGLHFVFYVGLMWGEAVSKGLFMGTWGADYLRYIFISDALLAFGLGLLYTAFADRVSNARLMVALSLVLGAGLVVVRALLVVNSRPDSLVYPLFFLLARAFRPLFTLHVLIYINDFYDTRAAKRTLPLIIAAAVAGTALAGVAIDPLITLWGEINLVLGWVGCLGLGLVLVWVCERWLGTVQDLSGASKKGPLDNLRGGFRFVRQSPFLRLLAVATLAMAFMNNLFDFQVNWAVAQALPGTAEQTIFYGRLGSLCSLLSLFIQMLLMGRIVAWLGVGTSNLIFPFSSLLAYSALGVWPGLGAAIGARLNAAVIKQSFRNPIDAMLYNAVPLQVKGRARSFNNGLLVPVGVFTVGALLFFVPRQASLPDWIVGVGIGVSVLYVALSLRLRGAYSRALVTLLEQEDFALYGLTAAELNIPDGMAFDRLVARLEASQNDEFTLFLAELIMQVKGRRALPVLAGLTRSAGVRVRSEVLLLLSEGDVAGPEVRALCLACLSDADSEVRRAALVALGRLCGPEDQDFLGGAMACLEDMDLEVRVQAIPPLIRSGDFFYQTAAIQALSELLKSSEGERRAVGVRALGGLDDARVIRTLVEHLTDSEGEVRYQAAWAIAHLSALSMPEWLLARAIEAAEKMLRDPTERVRLAGVATLGNVGGPLARMGLLSALADDSRHVREAVAVRLQSLGAEALPDLEAALARADDGDVRRQEALSIILARVNRARFAPLVEGLIADNLRAGHETLGALTALERLPPGAGVAMLGATLQARNDRRLRRIFDLIAALQPPESVEVVAEHLCSPSSRARANAVEALESLTVPQTARLILPLSQSPGTPEDRAAALALGQDMWGLSPMAPDQALRTYSKNDDPWLRAVAVYALGDVGPKLFERQELEQIFCAGCDDAAPALVQEASRIAWARIDAGGERRRCGREQEEGVMLSAIERVIFLKEVPFFESMTIEQLRGLAGASEERAYDEDAQVFAEGDPGDALYVVVRGRVGIERAGVRAGAVVRLATLSSRQYFGEMSIFDGAPRSASAIALEPTLLLSLRRAPLLALARENPDLSLALIQVLSQRLRETNRQISAGSKGRSRQLEKLYDKLGRE